MKEAEYKTLLKLLRGICAYTSNLANEFNLNYSDFDPIYDKELKVEEIITAIYLEDENDE